MLNKDSFLSINNTYICIQLGELFKIILIHNYNLIKIHHHSYIKVLLVQCNWYKYKSKCCIIIIIIMS